MTQTSVLPLPRCEPAELTQADDYTIRQAAEMTGLSEHTLRYYERARLLGSVRRERSSRHRRYSLAYWQAIAAGDTARADDLVQHMSRHLRRTS